MIRYTCMGNIFSVFPLVYGPGDSLDSKCFPVSIFCPLLNSSHWMNYRIEKMRLRIDSILVNLPWQNSLSTWWFHSRVFRGSALSQTFLELYTCDWRVNGSWVAFPNNWPSLTKLQDTLCSASEHRCHSYQYVFPALQNKCVFKTFGHWLEAIIWCDLRPGCVCCFTQSPYFHLIPCLACIFMLIWLRLTFATR